MLFKTLNPSTLKKKLIFRENFTSKIHLFFIRLNQIKTNLQIIHTHATIHINHSSDLLLYIPQSPKKVNYPMP